MIHCLLPIINQVEESKRLLEKEPDIDSPGECKIESESEAEAKTEKLLFLSPMNQKIASFFKTKDLKRYADEPEQATGWLNGWLNDVFILPAGLCGGIEHAKAFSLLSSYYAMMVDVNFQMAFDIGSQEMACNFGAQA